MSKLSGIVIAKNAENLINNCLKSLSFCDEIIVVDGGSKDRTVEIAKKMNAKVFEFKTEDYSEIRNYGREKANFDWILYVDVDERVTDSLRENIKYSCEAGSRFAGQISAFKLKRKNFYLGKYEWPYIEKIERLFKKDKLRGWIGKLHESPIVDGKAETLDGFLLHYTHRDLTSMLDKTIEWSKVEAETRFQMNHPKMTWWRFPRVMATAFLDSYFRQGGYKIGVAGLIESVYQAFSIFVTYARLWELQQKKK